jgi:hypothetical protein
MISGKLSAAMKGIRRVKKTPKPEPGRGGPCLWGKKPAPLSFLDNCAMVGAMQDRYKELCMVFQVEAKTDLACRYGLRGDVFHHLAYTGWEKLHKLGQDHMRNGRTVFEHEPGMRTLGDMWDAWLKLHPERVAEMWKAAARLAYLPRGFKAAARDHLHLARLVKRPMETMKLEEFLKRLEAQEVPVLHIAFVCPMCGHVQAAQDIIDVSVETPATVDRYIGFSCVGRWKDKGPVKVKKGKTVPQDGCDWTLGGLLKLQELEIETPDGRKHAHFAPATKEQAQQRWAAWKQANQEKAEEQKDLSLFTAASALENIEQDKKNETDGETG